MKLSECTCGTVVISDCGAQAPQIGMVVGITNNCQSSDRSARQKPENAIPLVKWSFGETYGIHHGNLKKYKG